MLNAIVKFVRVSKVSEADNPVAHAGNLSTYQSGQLNPGFSFPCAYVIEGWMVVPPTVGSPVLVLRTSRNGVAMPGVFKSTPVTVVPAPGEFHTANSKYLWIEVAPVGTPPEVI